MAWRAFIDESDGADGTFVLAGTIGRVEDWANFSKEWERLLRPMGTLAPDDSYHFKMAEMMALPERAARIPAFFEVLKKHSVLFVSFRFNISDFRRAQSRIFVPLIKLNWGFLNNPYNFAFYSFLEVFHKNREVIGSLIPEDAIIDFYFDERSEKRKIRAAWDGFIESAEPDIRAKYGNEPRFERDQDFLPLQGADLWAGWVRDCCVRGRTDQISKPQIGNWLGSLRPKTCLNISATEDVLTRSLIAQTRMKVPPQARIYDVQYPGLR